MQLHERYDDDPSTHLELDLNLWLEVGSSGGLYRNWVYSISNTRVEDMWARRSVSTIKSLQSASSSQSSQFQLILSQQIKTQTTHLATEIERLNAKTTELQQLYMELKIIYGWYMWSISLVPAKTRLFLLIILLQPLSFK